LKSDTLLVGWDDAEYTGSAVNYRAVYAASSADGFQNVVRVSTPGTHWSRAIDSEPDRRLWVGGEMDILWTENDPATGNDAPADRLMFADLGPVIARPIVASIVNGTTAATLKFTGVVGRYRVESSANLTAWTAVGTPVTAVAGSPWNFPKPSTAGFFRVTDVTPSRTGARPPISTLLKSALRQ
jgi:hypothetical protein